MIAESSHVKATSGADITVNTSKELIAKASSGGDVKYYGNPEKVEKSDGIYWIIKRQKPRPIYEKTKFRDDVWSNPHCKLFEIF